MSACLHDPFFDCNGSCRSCVRYSQQYECRYCGYGGNIYKINGECVCADCIEKAVIDGDKIKDKDALTAFLEDPDIERKYREHLQEYFSDCLIEEDAI